MRLLEQVQHTGQGDGVEFHVGDERITDGVAWEVAKDFPEVPRSLLQLHKWNVARYGQCQFPEGIVQLEGRPCLWQCNDVPLLDLGRQYGRSYW